MCGVITGTPATVVCSERWLKLLYFPIKAALPDPPQLCKRSRNASDSLENSCFKRMHFTEPIQVSTFFPTMKWCFFFLTGGTLHQELTTTTDLLLLLPGTFISSWKNLMMRLIPEESL